jgi:hypothetical protein
MKNQPKAKRQSALLEYLDRLAGLDSLVGWSCAIVTTMIAGCGGSPAENGRGNVSDTVGTASELLEADPSDLVRTPSGGVHRSCVHEVPNGATVAEDGTVTKEGRIIAKYDQCRYKPGGGPAPAINGWVENDKATTRTNTYGYNWPNDTAATWIVPPAPSSGDVGQTVYLFNSLQPTDVSSILQPVLQYGSTNGGGAYYTMANWCGIGNNFWHDTLHQVSPGDTIKGEMAAQSDSCDASGHCFWTVTYAVNNYAYYTTFSCNFSSKIFRRVDRAVLEVYGLTACGQFPNTGGTLFGSVFVAQPGPDPNGTWNLVLPSQITWSKESTIGLSPACSYSITDAPGTTGSDGWAKLWY